MKTFTVFTGRQLSTDVVDGPGWTDVYVDSKVKYIQPQYCSSYNENSSNRGNTNTVERD